MVITCSLLFQFLVAHVHLKLLLILQGSQPCTYYAQHGFCKFGPTCKFDHPMGTLNFSPSVSSLTDVPVTPYPLSFPVTPMAPYPSSSDLRPQYTLTKEHSANPHAVSDSFCSDLTAHLLWIKAAADIGINAKIGIGKLIPLPFFCPSLKREKGETSDCSSELRYYLVHN